MSVLITKTGWKGNLFPIGYQRLYVDISKFIDSPFVIHPSSELKSLIERKPFHPSVKVPIDDLKSRRSIWQTLFKDKPLPPIEEEAVEKYSGLLDKYLPDNIPVEDIIKHAKKG